jgi:N-sulfoglucosamine sulfohydrolase
MRRVFALLLMFVVFMACDSVQGAESKESKIKNIILITADDLNADSLGCFGCPVPEITPHLDTFAKGALRFDKAHVTVAICQPSRGVLHPGLYPHHSGIMGSLIRLCRQSGSFLRSKNS